MLTIFTLCKRCLKLLHFAKLKHCTHWTILHPTRSLAIGLLFYTCWLQLWKHQRVRGELVNENGGHLCSDGTFYLLWCNSNLWFLVYLTSSCPVYQTEASWSSAFLHWRRRQWKSRRWLPRYSNRGPTSPPLPSPLWAEGSLWSWTGTNRRFS